MNSKAYKLFGAALYWAEGSKTSHFSITNSDPYLILFMVKWFKKVFQVEPDQLRASLNIYSQQNERELKKFWSDLTEIPVKNFGRSYVKPPNKGYKKNNLYFGTIRVLVPKGTDMRHRTFGWIQGALQPIQQHIELTQKRWISLTNTNRPPVNLPPVA